jgi:hypothetical protein
MSIGISFLFFISYLQYIFFPLSGSFFFTSVRKREEFWGGGGGGGGGRAGVH